MAKLIGTAGHVDHGKTTLIKALTGIDADRLPEEKSRGMTIDVGFAFIDLPNAGRVSIVDVPGHEKFVRNMLVGALGFDLALLCVAADEGVKPQTREHLQILELLPVQKIIVVLTRCDLVDQETLELAELEVRELIDKTRFEATEYFRTSAHSGAGIDQLRTRLDELMVQQSSDDDAGWYMPIDRVFTLRGHGVVVTGTLAQGVVKTGESAIVEPGNHEVRIRSISSHETMFNSIESGRRVALNLSGVKQEDLHRGMMIGKPGVPLVSKIIDAEFRSVHPVKHGERIRLSIGSDEAIGKIFLNDDSPEWVQIRLEHDIVSTKNQPFILRKYSPPVLLGGGKVTIPQAKSRRKSEKVAPVLEEGQDSDRILSLLEMEPIGMMTEEICRRLGRSAQQLGPEFEKLLSVNQVIGFAGLWFSEASAKAAKEAFLDQLMQIHVGQPALAWQPRERVIQALRVSWTGKPLERMLTRWAQEGSLIISGTSVRHAEFRVRLSEKQELFLRRVEECLESAGLSTPLPADIAKLLGVPSQAVVEILQVGIAANRLIRIDESIFYSTNQIEKLIRETKQAFGSKSFAASDFRDHFQTSRKYVIPLLEYLDAKQVTMRQGDVRVLLKTKD